MPITFKDVKNTRYVYFSYYENGKKIEHYCGATTDPNVMEKAHAFEKEYLQKQITTLQEQLKELNSKKRQTRQVEPIKNDSPEQCLPPAKTHHMVYIADSKRYVSN